MEIDKVDLRSHGIAEDKKQELLRLFPEIQTEGRKIDLERLKLALGETVDVGKERYGMNWPGKADCFKAIQSPSLGTLRPCPEESVNFDTTKNLIIEGDNLEVLKLLQKSYLGKVSMIYIDPPYNTGNDFIYPDDYTESLQTYLEYTGQVDAQGKKFSTNTEADGRFHSKWVNMMYPRLYLARNLLREDGLLVCQIGDTELPNIRKVMDEIFGEENYINIVTIKAKVAAGASGGGEDKRLKKNMEFALVYARNLDAIEGFTQCFVEEPLTKVIQDMREANQSWKYTNVLLNEGNRRKIATTHDGEGNPIEIFLHEEIQRTSIRELCESEGLTEEDAYRKYLPKLFSDTNAQTSIRSRVINATGTLHEGQMYSVEYVPSSGRDKGKRVCHYYISPTVRRVIWLADVAYKRDGQVIKKERTGTLWDDISYNNIGKEGGVQFQNGKKPVELLRRVLQLSAAKDDLVMDFFAGSGTTAHAVLELNKEDVGNRKFILVQLPEPFDSTNKDQKLAYDFCKANNLAPNVAGITKERVRRVIKNLEDSEKQKLPLQGNRKQDLGFRVFKLAESNFKAWDANLPTGDVAVLKQQLELHIDHIRDARTPDDILYEILLKSGFQLATPVEKIIMEGKTVFSAAGGALFICLERELTMELIRAMADQKPERVVCLDKGFTGNDQLKANAVQIFKNKGVTSFKTV
ncbi:MAG: site-specific DNA-methyltransferase [Syntrophaceae bacterium]|nr:site-specific DNA-methyltransferase [Syntrophaceae bacterium]